VIINDIGPGSPHALAGEIRALCSRVQLTASREGVSPSASPQHLLAPAEHPGSEE